MNFNNVVSGGNVIFADHAVTEMKINLQISRERVPFVEVFDFSDPVGLDKFRDEQDDKFTKCFQTKLSLQNQILKWTHTLKSHCRNSF